MFQPTHPHGVRHRLRDFIPVGIFVSTHAPARGATCVRISGYHNRQRFNPRTRTGCDKKALKYALAISVSTHAPARGATYRADTIYGVAQFQPTHPHGVRPVAPESNRQPVRVSTHAPARGATARALSSGNSSSFQPTHPHGVRHHQNAEALTTDMFQPTRTRTGCDLARFWEEVELAVSTHAPARGATIIVKKVKKGHKSFNPRTRTGCDLALGVVGVEV